MYKITTVFKNTFFAAFPLKLLLLPVFMMLMQGAKAQESFPDYDELNVEINIPNLGVYEIPVAIKGQDAFIPVQELFQMLKIKAEETENGLEGFIIHPDSSYTINFRESNIHYKGEICELTDDDFIESPTGNYLKADHFGEIFGLDVDFSFRSLSVKMETDKELPILKEMRLNRLRENLDRVKGVVYPDTTISRSYPFFKPGMLDWGVVTTQQSAIEDDNRLLLGLGTMFLGGETNLMLNYSTRVPFDSRNQFYQWRYVDNDSRLFKQVTAGRIFTRATSSLFAPVSGVQVSNSPMQNRRSFGTYILNDHTEPRWTVELYVNNVLVDFTQADASGFYSFEVPLMYGNTAVSLRFYGPWGEERVEERVINIPYNFVPKNEVEYTLSAGVVENDDWDKFSRFNLNYGLSNAVTVGGGVEYLSGVTSGEVMPFINSSARLASGLLFSGEYMYGVKGDALLSYRTPRGLQVDLNYINYDKEQTAINFNYLEERKISLSAPIRTRAFSMFSRFSLNQIIMPTTEFTTAQLLLSGAVLGISTNLTTYGIYNDRIKKPTVYSSLSQTYRLPYRFLFSPQLQYDFSRNRVNNVIVELERPFLDRGFLNLAYENNFLRDAHIYQVGFRYTFDFAQTAFTSRIGNRNSSFVQSARGSLMLDDNTGHIMAGNRTAMSRAALTIIPFLDLNNNGKKDPMEPGVPGMELKNRMGQVTYSRDLTVLRITELQPYVDMLLEIDPVSLDNIAWRIPDSKIQVLTLPNHFQEIHVPVKVMGEAAGMVYFQDEKGIRGQGRITVVFKDENGNTAAQILTEGDGYFTFLGLDPGTYTAMIDPEQLNKLGYRSTPEQSEFEITVSEYGDIVDTLEFTLQPDGMTPVEENEGKAAPDTDEEVKETETSFRQGLSIDLGEKGFYAFSDTDENIQIIQQELKERGYYPGPIDGIYGNRTMQAVKSFQRNSRVRQDGIFGEITLEAMENDENKSDRQRKAKPGFDIALGERGYYSFGDTDQNIRTIQEALRYLGYEVGPLDGIYGKKTLEAVRKFQKDTRIRLDGIFGPQTLGSLKVQIANKQKGDPLSYLWLLCLINRRFVPGKSTEDQV